MSRLNGPQYKEEFADNRESGMRTLAWRGAMTDTDDLGHKPGGVRPVSRRAQT